MRRGGGSCFDLKIHTISASGVEKVKESPCVLIRKKPPDYFAAERGERIWEILSEVAMFLTLTPLPALSFLGEYESRCCVHRWFGKQEPWHRVWTLSWCFGHRDLLAHALFVFSFEGPRQHFQ